jgi:ribosomal protein S18 acetylase RimI-like enzyme
MDLCNHHDGLDLKLNLDTLPSRDDGAARDDFFLAYAHDELVGYVALDHFGAVAETCGMVHPAHRRRGIGRALLSAARRSVAAGGGRMVLICEDASPGGQAWLRTLPVELRFKEYRMDMRHAPEVHNADSALVTARATETDATIWGRILGAEFGEPPADHEMGFAQAIADPNQRYYIGRITGEPVGALKVIRCADRAGVYGFVILPEYRNRGMGRQMLTEVIQRTLTEWSAQPFLEVETDNANAIHLYRSCGFAITTTYGYYRIPLD